jgi:hypothetical protein
MKKRTMIKLLAAMVLLSASIALAGPVKGNPKSKIYHKAECKHYAAKGSTAEFASEAEAQKAGYKGCKKCAAPKAEKKAADDKE